ncbi:MAG: hypothetical protein ACKOBM_12580 [Gammaproteobacteria bacterium]
MSVLAPDALVLLVRTPPEAHAWPEEVFDPALVLAAFDQPVAVVFADAGLAFLGLTADATPTAWLPRSDWIDRLAEFGVTDIYAVSGHALSGHALSGAPVPDTTGPADASASARAAAAQGTLSWLSHAELGQVLAHARHVLVD